MQSNRKENRITTPWVARTILRGVFAIVLAYRSFNWNKPLKGRGMGRVRCMSSMSGDMPTYRAVSTTTAQSRRGLMTAIIWKVSLTLSLCTFGIKFTLLEKRFCVSLIHKKDCIERAFWLLIPHGVFIEKLWRVGFSNNLSDFVLHQLDFLVIDPYKTRRHAKVDILTICSKYWMRVDVYSGTDACFDFLLCYRLASVLWPIASHKHNLRKFQTSFHVLFPMTIFTSLCI